VQRERVRELPGRALRLLAAAVDEGRIGSAEHLRILLDLDLRGAELELALRDNCLLCHSNPDEQGEETLLAAGTAAEEAALHMRLAEAVADVHFRSGLSCAGCHGGEPTNTEMVEAVYERWPDAKARRTSRAWVPGFCGRCHADPVLMRRFDPALPTDQVAKYRTSRHGKAVLERNSVRAAECTDCHGRHGIRSASSPQSKVYPQQVPSTCGACHANPETMAGASLASGAPLPTDQLDAYRKSVHGRALLERGDTGAPACNDCHGNHAAVQPEAATVGQVCGTCHTGNAVYFAGSRHAQFFAQNGWPECTTCHGDHAIVRATDEMLGAAAGTVCHDCHASHAKESRSCDQVAAHFRRTVDRMADRLERFEETSEELAAKGLNAEPLEHTTAQIEDALHDSRSRVHAFDRSVFDTAAAPGLAAIDAGEQQIALARAEWRLRRRGLLFAIGALALLAVALYLRVRQLDRGR
jgi:hypothetical protein